MKKRVIPLFLVLVMAISFALMPCSAAIVADGANDGGQLQTAGDTASSKGTAIADETVDCSSLIQGLYGTLQNEAVEVIRENVSASNFGGLYLDDDGNLVVNVVDLNEATKICAAFDNDASKRVTFSKVKYSLEYLESAADMLVPYMSTYNILTLDANDKTNQLDIGISDTSEGNLKKLLATIESLSIPSECVKIIDRTGVSVKTTA